jgi:hypothetical protein
MSETELLADLGVWMPPDSSFDALDTLRESIAHVSGVRSTSLLRTDYGVFVILVDFDSETRVSEGFDDVADVIRGQGYDGAIGDAGRQVAARRGYLFQPGKFARIQIWAEPA